MKSLYKIIAIVAAACLAVYTGFLVFKSSSFGPGESSLFLKGENIIGLNSAAKNSALKKVGKNPYLYYGFTQNQYAGLINFAARNNGAAIKVTLKIEPNPKGYKEEVPFHLGFIYNDDFKNDYMLKKELSSRNLASFDYSKIKGNTVSLSMCIGNQIPKGFFVYGRERFSITSVEYVAKCAGWGKNPNPYFAFGSNGGIAEADFMSVDFSGCSDFILSQNILPYLSITVNTSSDIGVYSNQKRFFFNYGNKNMAVRFSPSFANYKIQTGVFDEPLSVFALKENVTQNQDVTSVFLLQNKPAPVSSLAAADDSDDLSEGNRLLQPLETDIGFIPEYTMDHWRSLEKGYELFCWQYFPNVLIFDFENYRKQNQFFTRLAYFVEKTGYVGTLVGDDFVENKHGYNAHDYKAKDLAAFYNKVWEENFPINQEEQELCRILLANGIILQNEDGSYGEGKGAVISISQESAEYLRRSLLAHESWHGIYFMDEEFRNTVAALYYMFDPDSLEFLKQFWESQPTLAYDRNDEYLMQNEFMAYMMQTGLANIQNYFITRANWNSVNNALPELAAYVRKTEAAPFYETASILNGYVFDRWGFASGRVNLIYSLD